MLIIVSSDNFPQYAAAATVSTMEAVSVDGSIQCAEGVLSTTSRQIVIKYLLNNEYIYF